MNRVIHDLHTIKSGATRASMNPSKRNRAATGNRNGNDTQTLPKRSLGKKVPDAVRRDPELRLAFAGSNKVAGDLEDEITAVREQAGEYSVCQGSKKELSEGYFDEIKFKVGSNAHRADADCGTRGCWPSGGQCAPGAPPRIPDATRELRCGRRGSSSSELG
jgi:hypothetical protein